MGYQYHRPGQYRVDHTREMFQDDWSIGVW